VFWGDQNRRLRAFDADDLIEDLRVVVTRTDRWSHSALPCIGFGLT
jgi:hypothetical protein